MLGRSILAVSFIGFTDMRRLFWEMGEYTTSTYIHTYIHTLHSVMGTYVFYCLIYQLVQ